MQVHPAVCLPTCALAVCPCRKRPVTPKASLSAEASACLCLQFVHQTRASPADLRDLFLLSVAQIRMSAMEGYQADFVWLSTVSLLSFGVILHGCTPTGSLWGLIEGGTGGQAEPWPHWMLAVERCWEDPLNSCSVVNGDPPSRCSFKAPPPIPDEKYVFNLFKITTKLGRRIMGGAEV